MKGEDMRTYEVNPSRMKLDVTVDNQTEVTLVFSMDSQTACRMHKEILEGGGIVAEVLPGYVPSNKDECHVCQGSGELPTTIKEGPMICTNCEGIGTAVK